MATWCFLYGSVCPYDISYWLRVPCLWPHLTSIISLYFLSPVRLGVKTLTVNSIPNIIFQSVLAMPLNSRWVTLALEDNDQKLLCCNAIQQTLAKHLLCMSSWFSQWNSIYPRRGHRPGANEGSAGLCLGSLSH